MEDDRQLNARLERFLGDAQSPVSEADIAAGTGIGVDTVSRLLRAIMLRYECNLQVRDDGAIVYDFGGGLTRIGAPTFQERLRSWADLAWRIFAKVYRSALALVLVAYALTFFILLMAAAIAASAATEDEEPAKGAMHLVGAVFRAIFEFTTHTALIHMQVDSFGYEHKQFQASQPILKKSNEPQAKSFIAAVYDFVLGPERVTPAPGAQEREVAAFVRTNDGVLTISDIQALSGMSRDEAGHYFARFTALFDGDAIISERGALVARFPGLLESVSSAHDDEIQFFWDEYEPPFELTGNTTGRNIAIGALAAFNLIGALTVTSAGLPGALGALLGIVPLTIFSLFFLIPIARVPFVFKRNKDQHKTNIRKRLYKEVFRGNEESLRFDDLVDWANHNKTTEEQLSATRIRPLLEQTSYELGGSYDMDEDDRLAMDTSLLRRERKARAEFAAHAVQTAAEPQLVFDTRD